MAPYLVAPPCLAKGGVVRAHENWETDHTNNFNVKIKSIIDSIININIKTDFIIIKLKQIC